MEMRTLAIASLAAGGDGVARDEGRVTFVPRTAPGDRVRARLVQVTKSFARAELVSVEEPSPDRVTPPCAHFVEGCGGCTWQHVSRTAQLAAKQAIVAGALRKLTGLTVHPIEDPAPPLGWRRRARFHVARGQLGLYVEASHTVLPIERCPQLEPALDVALAAIRAASPPDGELSLLLGYRGEIVVGVARPWKLAASLIGRAGIVGVVAGASRGSAGISSEASDSRTSVSSDSRTSVSSDSRTSVPSDSRTSVPSDSRTSVPSDASGTSSSASDISGVGVIEIEPGLWGGPNDFAQASAAGNAALVARTRAALGTARPAATSVRSTSPVPSASASASSTSAPHRLVELYAGAGNLTRAFIADGWSVIATDGVAPARLVGTGANAPSDATNASSDTGSLVEHRVGPVADILATIDGPVDAVVLDPPRAGAADAIDGIVRLSPHVIVYVSCDPATLARDLERLIGAGYRATDAWPIDLMPQTAHVEVVVRLVRSDV